MHILCGFGGVCIYDIEIYFGMHKYLHRSVRTNTEPNHIYPHKIYVKNVDRLKAFLPLSRRCSLPMRRMTHWGLKFSVQFLQQVHLPYELFVSYINSEIRYLLKKFILQSWIKYIATSNSVCSPHLFIRVVTVELRSRITAQGYYSTGTLFEWLI